MAIVLPYTNKETRIKPHTKFCYYNYSKHLLSYCSSIVGTGEFCVSIVRSIEVNVWTNGHYSVGINLQVTLLKEKKKTITQTVI